MKRQLLFSRRSGQGPVLVLIHGVIGSSAIWDLVVPHLEKDFDVICFDLLGYGRSPKPLGSYTPKRHVTMIHDSLEALGVSEPFYLAGLSMGALLALNYTVSYPKDVRKLICLSLPDYTSRQEAATMTSHNAWVRLMLRHPRTGQIVIASSWALGRRVPALGRKFAPSFYTPRMARESLLAHFRSFRSSLIHCLLRNAAKPLLAQTDKIERLFIHGDLDNWAPLENLQRDLKHRPHAPLHVLPGIGHNIAAIAPDGVSRLMSEFLLSK
jgi:pimeloyl-ACP methyl ester carboxylesterase